MPIVMQQQLAQQTAAPFLSSPHVPSSVKSPSEHQQQQQQLGASHSPTQHTRRGDSQYLVSSESVDTVMSASPESTSSSNSGGSSSRQSGTSSSRHSPMEDDSTNTSPNAAAHTAFSSSPSHKALRVDTQHTHNGAGNSHQAPHHSVVPSEEDETSRSTAKLFQSLTTIAGGRAHPSSSAGSSSKQSSDPTSSCSAFTPASGDSMLSAGSSASPINSAAADSTPLPALRNTSSISGVSNCSVASSNSSGSASTFQSSNDSSPIAPHRLLEIEATPSHTAAAGGAHTHASSQGPARVQRNSADMEESTPVAKSGPSESHHQYQSEEEAAGSSASTASHSGEKKDVDMGHSSGDEQQSNDAASTVRARNNHSYREAIDNSDARSNASSYSSSSSTSTSSSTSSSGQPPRYKPIRTLQNSLFGQVQLAFDNFRQVPVAVKVSHAALVAPKSQTSSHNSTPNAPNDTTLVDDAATARSQAGVSVLEDVRREARILRLLLGADQPPVTTATIDGASCGLSTALVDAINLPQNAVVQPGATNPLTIQQQFLDSISKGKKCIAGFYDEVEAESFHYLISEYVPGGDLFSVLTAQPHHRVNEQIGRQWMYQLCCAVRYMHAHSIAHLDLSLENICLDDKGAVRLIDFGLAAQHPSYSGDKCTKLPDGTKQRNASAHIKLLSDSSSSFSGSATGSSSCSCSACQSTFEELMTGDPSIRQCTQSKVPLSKLKYLCRPVCEKVHKPGKLGYLAPELYSNHCWEAYKHDIFGLGVILYSMLTGRPPFTRPDESSDVWFKVIYTGQWLLSKVRSQPPAAIYNGLSTNALDLINRCIAPQHERPTIDQLLKHPFFAVNHPMNAPPTKSEQEKTAGGGGKSSRIAIKRSGSQ